METIKRTLDRLWHLMLGPVDERMQQLTRERGPVLMLPQGALGLLPLHAATNSAKGTVFSDLHPVAYAPSLRSVRAIHLRRRKPRPSDISLVAVGNPTGDLPFSAVEVRECAKLFRQIGSRPEVFVSGIDDEAIARKGYSASYLHFACHGKYGWQNVMESELLLSTTDPLTMPEVLKLFDMPATRLVTLSACELGLHDTDLSPDEYVGLPAAFLQRGADAVLSSLWSVADESTCILIREFYRRHLHEAQSPTEALAEAQRWLRQATVEESGLDELGEELVASGEATLQIAERARLYAANPTLRPFEHPYYWASFTLTGL